VARVDIEQGDLLERIATLLRRGLRLDKRSCFLTISPLSVAIPPGGDFFVSVSPGEGSFQTEDQHEEQCTEFTTVTVTGYTRIRVDSTGHDDKLLLEAARGLLRLKGRILKVLVGKDPSVSDKPTAAEEDQAVRQLLFAIRAHRPEYDEKRQIGWLSIDFGVDFDWDLSDDEG
jgi:hypothetical protein